MKRLSLAEIVTLLEIHYRADDYIPSPAHARVLFSEGLAATCLGEGRPKYSTTPKGIVYVEAIRDLPLPVATWTIPSKD